MVEGFLAFLSYLESVVSPDNAVGLFALFAIAVITDIGVPVPFVLEGILLVTAYHFGPLSTEVLLAVIALFVGRQAGSAVLYFLSFGLGNVFLNWVMRYFPSLSKRLVWLMNYLNQTHRTAVAMAMATSRLTPGLTQVTSVAAGAIHLRYYHFFLGITIASFIYDGVMILLGFVTSRGPKSGDINFTIWSIISILIVLVFLWPLTYVLLRRNNKNNSHKG